MSPSGCYVNQAAAARNLKRKFVRTVDFRQYRPGVGHTLPVPFSRRLQNGSIGTRASGAGDIVRKEIGAPEAECLAADPKFSLIRTS